MFGRCVQGCCRWCSRTGDRLTLRPTMLVALTETEAMGFRALAVYRLQIIGIGCKVDVPRGDLPPESAEDFPPSMKEDCLPSVQEARNDMVSA
ncbi:hypothetical protein MRX96_058544 [Rhipicephalus microplus]